MALRFRRSLLMDIKKSPFAQFTAAGNFPAIMGLPSRGTGDVFSPAPAFAE